MSDVDAVNTLARLGAREAPGAHVIVKFGFNLRQISKQHVFPVQSNRFALVRQYVVDILDVDDVAMGLCEVPQQGSMPTGSKEDFAILTAEESALLIERYCCG